MLKVGDVVEITDNANMKDFGIPNHKIGSKHIVSSLYEGLGLPTIVLDGMVPIQHNAWYSYRFKFVDHIELNANTNIEKLLQYINI